jgi:SAM-dependent methyltransferase
MQPGRITVRNSGAMDDAAQTPGALHPLVGGFSDAAVYDAGRPRYGRAVVSLLVEQLELAPGAPVLELGAGTGQLSRALLDAGLELTAVEPLGPTRELLIAAIGSEHVRAGRAEQIPLEDGSVEAVFAADSFHWFDETRAMPEIKRVLRPRGGVAILRMLPRLERPWSRELGEILIESRPEHPAFGERSAAAALEEDAAFGPVTHTAPTTPGVLEREQLLAWVASFSWVAVLATPERERLLERVEELLARHDVSRVEYDVLHQLWLARLL